MALDYSWPAGYLVAVSGDGGQIFVWSLDCPSELDLSPIPEAEAVEVSRQFESSPVDATAAKLPEHITMFSIDKVPEGKDLWLDERHAMAVAGSIRNPDISMPCVTLEWVHGFSPSLAGGGASAGHAANDKVHVKQ